MKRIAVLTLLCAGLFCPIWAQTSPAKPGDLILGSADLRIEQNNDGGYLLYIRKKPNIESVVLTESTKDPENKLASYSLRSKELSALNGIQQKKLDGQLIEAKNLYFLMSSTAIDDAKFGKAFRIFIPYVVVYGFPWSRYGEIQLQDGAYISIRSFAKAYADYEGGFYDNPYLLRLNQVVAPRPTEGYNKETTRTFSDYAAINSGKVRYSKGPADLMQSLQDLLNGITDQSIDIALCMDATESMKNDAVFVREKLVPLLQDFAVRHPKARFAIVQYRDYMEDFLYKVTPFGNDFSIIQTAISQYKPAGGRDTPEAVNEALYASLTELEWTATSRVIVLVGDAPPHPIPRGSVSADMISKESKKRNVTINPVILPD